MKYVILDLIEVVVQGDGFCIRGSRMSEKNYETSELKELKDVLQTFTEFVWEMEEYLPEFYEAQMKMCEELDVDYLIMGQHFLPESLIYAGSRTGSRRVLEQYVDTVLEGLSTGAYSCLCHPDLVDFAGDGAFYRKQMRRLCEGVKKMGIPLEINLLGLGEGRHYPNERFWTIAGETGNRAIIGVDAHDPASIGKHRIFEAALALAERCGLEVEERMEFSATAPWRQRL